VALVGALIGLLLGLLGMLLTLRSERAMRWYTVPPNVVEEVLLDIRRAVEAGELDPATAKNIEHRIMNLHFNATSRMKANVEVEKAGTPRSGTHPRTVEVQSQDGSSVTLGVDPSDPDSIDACLRSARHARGDRVLTVH